LKTASGSASKISGQTRKINPAPLSDIRSTFTKSPVQWFPLGIRELDRVLGGGVVPGEILLLAGEPGIGKSTLLLQVALGLDKPVIYVSGEESLAQLSTRVERLTRGESLRGGVVESTASHPRKLIRASAINTADAVSTMNLKVTDESDVDSVIAAVADQKPRLVIVDSIQAVSTSDVSSYPGSVSQVRECGARLTQCAKKLGVPIILVGQVTKSGAIAGPKVLEHIVDAVLSFEGDESGMYRLVRCLKNRFGATDEVGVFEMTQEGLMEVKDPSSVFTSRSQGISGTAISAVYRGSRVLLIEVQALTSPAVFGSARRFGNGVSKQRVEMLCAVLSRRGGVDVSSDDVYVSVLGGIQIDDPGVDLAICIAIASARTDRGVKTKTAWVGEVGLTGEVRHAAHLERITKTIIAAGLSTTKGQDKTPVYLRDTIKSSMITKNALS
jgi:DNA repair protein RadA/Sms